MPTYPTTRLRRTRKTQWSRRLVRENRLSTDDLIWTCILSDGETPRDPVPSMPGVDRVNVDEIVKDARRAHGLGIPAMAVFPHINPAFKDASGSEAANPDGVVPRAVKAIKDAVPDMGIIVDAALDPYTDHGHDGLLHDGQIINDASVDALCDVAVMLADAGADVVAPSDMMDGRVGMIRQSLEATGHKDVLIMSYAAKYASGFYGPYRDAIGSATALTGDKRSYQMDPANTDEALREVAMDIDEGADMIMVKPGMPYLDIIGRISCEFSMPTYAFQVSGEYAMIMAAAQNEWLDEQRVIMESLLCFKRAGCDGILTYFAPRAAQWLAETN